VLTRERNGTSYVNLYKEARCQQAGHSRFGTLGLGESRFWKGEEKLHASREIHGSTVTAQVKDKTTTLFERRLRSYVGNDGTLSVYFLYYVVYSFNYV
jgi:hypothetical protein